MTLLIGGYAFANISIYPYNLDFLPSSRKRVQSVRIINRSNEKQTYRVSIIDLKQDANGNLKKADNTKTSAKNYLQFSPRQFTLEPNLTQTINVAQKGLANAPDGEFFSFLQISEVKLGEPPKKDKNKTKKLSIELIPLFSVRIPVKILKGTDLVNNAEIVSTNWSKDQLNVTLKRTGNISSNVNLVLLDDEKNEVARVNSVKIYPPNDKLKVKLPIKKGTFKQTGTLKLEDAVSKQEIFTQSIHK